MRARLANKIACMTVLLVALDLDKTKYGFRQNQNVEYYAVSDSRSDESRRVYV